MAQLYYQGHGSFRITAADGRVIYVDPYAGDGYAVPADIILITHHHGDHNQVQRVTQKTHCQLVTPGQALANGQYNRFTFNGITVEAVPAHNANHRVEECVGYLIEVDGVKLYASGDTSKTEQMKALAALKLDYALLCSDGKYNMDLPEAAECAAIIGARHNIPIHISPGNLFDRARAESWEAPNRLIVMPGETLTLTAK